MQLELLPPPFLAQNTGFIADGAKASPRKRTPKKKTTVPGLETPPVNRRKAKIEFKKEEQEVEDPNKIEVAPMSNKKRQRARSPSTNIKRRPSK